MKYFRCILALLSLVMPILSGCELTADDTGTAECATDLDCPMEDRSGYTRCAGNDVLESYRFKGMICSSERKCVPDYSVSRTPCQNNNQVCAPDPDSYGEVDDCFSPSEQMGGEPMAGEPIAGEPMAGEPMAGEPMAGEPMAGEPMAGEPMAGEPMAGEPMAGELMAGEPMAGEPMAGELMAGEPNTSNQVTAQMISGEWTRCQSETARSLRHTFSFNAINDQRGTWRYEEDRFGEEQCIGEPSMTLIRTGEFSLGVEAELSVPVREIMLSYESILVRANNQNTAELLGSTICPNEQFSVNIPTDLSERGCERLDLIPISECAQRYDLIGFEDMTLIFGVSINLWNGLCVESDRPMIFGAPPLSRTP